jgi:hypothetical protein
MVQIFIQFLHHTLQSLCHETSYGTSKRIKGVVRFGVSVLSYLEIVRILEF